MYFEPWMLELLKNEEFRQTRQGRIYTLVKHFAKDFPEEISCEDFEKACEDEGMDFGKFTKDDLYQVKVKLKQLEKRYGREYFKTVL